MKELKMTGPTFRQVMKRRKTAKSSLEFFKELDEIYPGKLTFRSIKGNMVTFLSDPELIRYVLQTNQKSYVKHSVYDVLKLILGRGLVTSEGPLWKRQRKMIQPSFHKKIINGFFDTMVNCTNEMIEEWKAKIKTDDTLDFSEEMSSVTLHIIGLTMLSTNVKNESQIVSSSLRVLSGIFRLKTRSFIKIPLWVPTKVNRNFIKSRKAILSILENIIIDRKKNGNDKGDMLDMLMLSKYKDDGGSMPDDLLRDELMTTFLAGHETTSSALMWTFHFLSQNPESYKKLKQEVDEVLKGQEITFEHLRQLPYTRACINESMRLIPPVWMIGRKATEDNMVGDYLIKKGTDVLVSTYLAHRDPNYWKKPDEFMPERWETEEVKKIHKFAYYPFGGGPRMCIGNNMALLESDIILAKVIQQFSFEYAGKKPPFIIAGVTTNSRYGMPMKIKKVFN